MCKHWACAVHCTACVVTAVFLFDAPDIVRTEFYAIMLAFGWEDEEVTAWSDTYGNDIS